VGRLPGRLINHAALAIFRGGSKGDARENIEAGEASRHSMKFPAVAAPATSPVQGVSEMSRIHGCCAVVAFGLLTAIAAVPASARAPAATGSSATPQARRTDFTRLFTNYFFGTGATSVNLVVCGAVDGSSGCYGSADLGPFGHVGAVIEGKPKPRRGNIQVRDLYVVDDAAGHGTDVTLDVYQETITAEPPFATVSVTQTNTIALPLKGGTGAKTYMAADNVYLFIGTNQSPFAVVVDKYNLAFGEIPGFSPPANVSAITANDNGYVVVTFGNEGFYAYGPAGEFEEDGGGPEYTLNSSVGLSTGNVATSSMIARPPLKVRLTHPASRGMTGR
jgi:hypothetical protein